MDLESCRDAVLLLGWVKERRAELDEVEKVQRATIEEALGEDEIGELDGKVAVTWRHVKSRRLNQRVLKDRFPDIHALCVEMGESRQFKVER